MLNKIMKYFGYVPKVDFKDSKDPVYAGHLDEKRIINVILCIRYYRDPFELDRIRALRNLPERKQQAAIEALHTLPMFAAFLEKQLSVQGTVELQRLDQELRNGRLGGVVKEIKL